MSHVELPEAPEAGTTPFKRRLAILVGISAVVAALLATLEVDSGRRADRASVDGSRRAVAIFEQIADSGLDLTGAADVLRDEFSFANEAQQRVLRATGLLPLGIGAAQVEAAKSLDAQLAATIGTAISPAGALKLQQRQRAEAEAQNRAVARQNAAVAAAERYGHRRSRTVFALSVLASAGALFGLAGVLEAGRSASLVLATGAAALAVSIATGISALLL
jgi:hypothetical protein